MKKRALFFVVFIMLLNWHSIDAALGISPALIQNEFSPNQKFFVNFQVLGADTDQKLEVYAAEDLAEYVTFDRKEFTGQGGFTAYVTLPEHIEKPGKNKLYIRVSEVKEANSGIGTRLEVGALIVIKVPYPGKYAEIKSFRIGNVNENEPIRIFAELESLGYEDIFASSKVDIYSSAKLVESIVLGERTVKSRTVETFEKTIKGYSAGLYNATLSVNYGKIIEGSLEFKVGKLFVDIVNWSKMFTKGKINEFNIDIESKWNNDLKNIHAEVNVSKDSVQKDYFKTPSVDLEKWQKATLKGFFNSENLESGRYNAEIKLLYENEMTIKNVEIKVISPEDNKMFMIIISVVMVMALFLAIIIYLLYKLKKNGKK